MADTLSDGGKEDDNDDGAIVMDVCGGRPAILAAATGDKVTFSIVVSFVLALELLPAPELRLRDDIERKCLSSPDAAAAAAIKCANSSFDERLASKADVDMRDRFDFGSSIRLPYELDADDVGISEIPEPMPKLRANNST